MGIWQMAGITEKTDKTLSWKGFTVWCSVCCQSVRIYLASEIYQYCVQCPKGIWEAYGEGPALETFLSCIEMRPHTRSNHLCARGVSCGGGCACHRNSEKGLWAGDRRGCTHAPEVHWKLLQATTPSLIINCKEIKSDVSKKKKENS